MKDYIVVFSTISTKDEAKRISYELVKKKVAGCVNIISDLTSIYEWKGEICSENECLMIIKTRKELFDELKNEITLMHPYEIPEVIALDISEGLQSYLNWITGNTKLIK